MTYRRVINRNGLREGGYDYNFKNEVFDPGNIFGALPDIDQHRIYENTIKSLYERVNSYRAKNSNLLGDLRRLEMDTIDENATAKAIALKTGVDVEIVAAVLKEFMNW